MKIYAQIHRIENEQSFNEGKFITKIVVLKTLEQYSQVIPIQFENDKIKLLEGFTVGQSVEVEYNLRGKEYTKQDGTISCFITLAGWKIEKTK